MIGILAGMGPKSTGPFVDTVVARSKQYTEQSMIWTFLI